MNFIVALSAAFLAVACAYGPPPSGNQGGSGCGSGGCGEGGSNFPVQNKPLCHGGNCGGVGSNFPVQNNPTCHGRNCGGNSPSKNKIPVGGPYWWEGSNNPFVDANGCYEGKPGCPGSGTGCLPGSPGCGQANPPASAGCYPGKRGCPKPACRPGSPGCKSPSSFSSGTSSFGSNQNFPPKKQRPIAKPYPKPNPSSNFPSHSSNTKPTDLYQQPSISSGIINQPGSLNFPQSNNFQKPDSSGCRPGKLGCPATSSSGSNFPSSHTPSGNFQNPSNSGCFPGTPGCSSPSSSGSSSSSSSSHFPSSQSTGNNYPKLSSDGCYPGRLGCPGALPSSSNIPSSHSPISNFQSSGSSGCRPGTPGCSSLSSSKFPSGSGGCRPGTPGCPSPSSSKFPSGSGGCRPGTPGCPSPSSSKFPSGSGGCRPGTPGCPSPSISKFPSGSGGCSPGSPGCHSGTGSFSSAPSSNNKYQHPSSGGGGCTPGRPGCPSSGPSTFPQSNQGCRPGDPGCGGSSHNNHFPAPPPPTNLQPLSSNFISTGVTMNGMPMMMMNVGTPLIQDSCSASVYCVPRNTCNPYTGFIIRNFNMVAAVQDGAPQVPKLRCTVLSGEFKDGVCCQESHPIIGPNGQVAD